MYTPETSHHFTKQIDPRSGMCYFVLTTRVAPIQQGFYFINSGCENSPNGSFIGTVEVANGEYTQWYKTEPGIPYNHAQFCPTNPNLIMVAHEGSPDPKTVKHISPACTPEGIYPRLQLISRDGSREMRKPFNNYATHECWSADGKSIYYCTSQHIAIDCFGDNEAKSVCKIPIEGGNGTWHAHATADGSAYIVDGWTPENPSTYHIDPHPRFVWDDDWVTFTTTVNGKVDVALAPVAQLKNATE